MKISAHRELMQLEDLLKVKGGKFRACSREGHHHKMTICSSQDEYDKCSFTKKSPNNKIVAIFTQVRRGRRSRRFRVHQLAAGSAFSANFAGGRRRR